jgi:drug/metabolite transporter (DMT)-like permease
MAALSACLACTLGGTALVTMRYGIMQSDIYAVALWRQLGPFAVFGLVALVVGARRLRIARGDIGMLVVLGVAQYGLVNYLMTASVAYIPAARAALIMGVMPLATLGVGALLGRERFTMPKLVGAAVALVGIAVALGDEAAHAGTDAWKGDLLMLAGTVGGGLNSIFLAPFLQRYGPLSVGTVTSAIGVVATFACVVAFGTVGAVVAYDPAGWVATAWTGLGGGAASLFFWIWALRHATPSRVTVAISFNPIAAAALGAVMLGEHLSLRLLVGLGGVVAGIVIAYWPGRPAAATDPGGP